MNIDVNIVSDTDSDEDLEDFVNIIYRRARILRQRVDHLNHWDEYDFLNRFRLTKHTVQLLCHQIEDLIRYQTERNFALSPMQQLLLCLRFFATGNFQINVGDHSGVHQSTASKIIRRVTAAICSIKQNYVKLPERQEVATIHQGFFNIAAFPRVLLVVDGTHIRIQGPGGQQAEWFRNRKGYFSINAMVACDNQMHIRNIVSRWPGSAHDITVFNNSALKARFENEFENSVIIGDSGYGIEKYFMTPLEAPVTEAEIRYQESLVRTRNIIERCIGVWKRRFPCLALGLRTSLETTQDIIVATSLLHNIARIESEPEPSEINEEIEALINDVVPVIPANNNDANGAYRRELIEQYFARL